VFREELDDGDFEGDDVVEDVLNSREERSGGDGEDRAELGDCAGGGVGNLDGGGSGLQEKSSGREGEAERGENRESR
jgi:hypothetical protein